MWNPDGESEREWPPRRKSAAEQIAEIAVEHGKRNGMDDPLVEVLENIADRLARRKANGA